MADVGCCKVMEAMGFIFAEERLDEIGEELLRRFRSDERFGDIIAEIGDRYRCFPGKTRSSEARRIIEHWPAAHLAMVRSAIIWGITNRNAGVPTRFHWKGDDEHPETVTRFEIKDADIYVEFAHPPAFAQHGKVEAAVGA